MSHVSPLRSPASPEVPPQQPRPEPTSFLMHTQMFPGWLQTTQPYKRWSCHSGLKLPCKLCRTSPPPDLPCFGHAGHADPLDGWRCCSQKAGDVETNPGATTLNKKFWICDICHKQIHVRKLISIRCNRIEHWVHLRCAGIRQAQYTDTWTCHLHRESRLTPQTDITPPHRSRPLVQAPYPLPTYTTHTTHTTATKTQTHVQHSPLYPEDW